MAEINWEKVKPLLGTKSDKDIATEIGSSPATVARKRVSYGIQSYGAKFKIDWEEWIPLMGETPDPILADRIGCSVIALRKKRRELNIKSSHCINWKHWDHLLGKEPDSAIASRAGCLEAAVRRRREELQIAPWIKSDLPYTATNSSRRVNWAKWDHLLGTDTDYQVAKIIGCQPPAVSRRRKKLNIQAFANKK